jgi:hypothetical protein
MMFLITFLEQMDEFEGEARKLWSSFFYYWENFNPNYRVPQSK